MARVFYNTIGLTPPDLHRAEQEAISLQQLVLKIFKKNPGKRFSPSQIHKVIEMKYFKKNPITSVRRAITNLSHEDFGEQLEKTHTLITGPYGYPEHTWRTTRRRRRIVA